MNYPVTNGYVAERLRRALEYLHKGSVIYADIASLACYFQLSEDFAALTIRDQETIAEMARSWVERDERIRGENEMVSEILDAQQEAYDTAIEGREREIRAAERAAREEALEQCLDRGSLQSIHHCSSCDLDEDEHARIEAVEARIKLVREEIRALKSSPPSPSKPEPDHFADARKMVGKAEIHEPENVVWPEKPPLGVRVADHKACGCVEYDYWDGGRHRVKSCAEHAKPAPEPEKAGAESLTEERVREIARQEAQALGVKLWGDADRRLFAIEKRMPEIARELDIEQSNVYAARFEAIEKRIEGMR